MEVSTEIVDMDPDTTCPICNAEFLDNDDLNIHMNQHILVNVAYKHLCVACNKIFPDMEYYAQHIVENHLISAVSCSYCSRVFYDWKLLKNHEIKHNATSLTSRISCSQCMSYFYNNTDLEIHEFQEHSESKDGIMLQECFSMLSSLLNMNIREFFDVHHENITYKCTFCNLCTPDVGFFIKHLQEEKVKSFSCDNCYNVFPRKSMLRHHFTDHKCKNYSRKNNPEKQCQKCQQRFLNSSYKRHIKLCTGMKCIPCNMNFESVDEYSTHLKFHKKAIPLSSCKYCCRQFVGDYSLEKHIERTHKNSFHLYKYKCVDCDQLFMHPKLLFTHYFTKHKNLEPYTCKICNETFKLRKKFTLHIKLKHNSIGFVEFDKNYLVFFTDNKSEKPFIPQCQIPLEDMGETVNKSACKVKQKNSKLKVRNNEQTKDHISSDLTIEGELSTNSITNMDSSYMSPDKNYEYTSVRNKFDEANLTHTGFDFMDVTETEGDHTEAESNLLKKRKRKTKIIKSRRKPCIDSNTHLSSDDSDAPLVAVKNKGKFKQHCNIPTLKRINEKFICKKCDKNCYTYQNYHHHLSLHTRHQSKQCIKCEETFKSKSALADHIEKNHSSSKLTDTLKQLLERRKNNVPVPKDRKSIAEGLRKTIKKVVFEKCDSTITLTPVDNKISVKNFFENFTPDIGEMAAKNYHNGITIKEINISDIPSSPVIKMSKFIPEVMEFNPRPKMPVKFKDLSDSEKYKVSFKLSTINQSKPMLKFSHKMDETDLNTDLIDECFQFDQTYTDQFDVESNVEQKEDSIPEMAEEVMLNTEPEKRDTITVESIPEQYANLKIGHLQEIAPYYKIVNINEVIKTTSNKKQEKTEPAKKIVLPDGTKLVNVNPLAHLMGNTSMEEIFKPTKRYYKPKPRDITTAIAKALDQNKSVRKKKL